ncbi:hypothetical protein NE562_04465 [Butyricicoccus faecihominis]|uniref:hypothetical protein n=1 Tax=Butyricicoccus faecihominis TaxID=1712515 RepID=UPI002479D82D|nr:hypothetical protein [Butyricicoccus faecihominis]MCQ5128902.1 hypothetical protein [Butyricicoccus faecihominis]
MGNRAIYQILENGESAVFTSHNGANALSPLLRLAQAKQIQARLAEPLTIAHIFTHLGDDGQYHNPRLPDEDMFCAPVKPEQRRALQESYNHHSGYEMHITLDLDHDNCNLSYNPNCPWYRTMGSLSISLTDGLANVERLLEHGRERGITDFYRLLAIYDRSTGLAEMLESARGSMRMEEYLDSPEAEEQRQRYRELAGCQAEPENEEMEEQ